MEWRWKYFGHSQWNVLMSHVTKMYVTWNHLQRSWTHLRCDSFACKANKQTYKWKKLSTSLFHDICLLLICWDAVFPPHHFLGGRSNFVWPRIPLPREIYLRIDDCSDPHFTWCYCVCIWVCVEGPAAGGEVAFVSLKLAFDWAGHILYALECWHCATLSLICHAVCGFLVMKWKPCGETL